jgi:hypothetical protein
VSQISDTQEVEGRPHGFAFQVRFWVLICLVVLLMAIMLGLTFSPEAVKALNGHF